MGRLGRKPLSKAVSKRFALRVLLPVGLALTLVTAYVLSQPAEARQSVQITRIRYDPPGLDGATNTALNGERVIIENTGSEPVDLTGWSITDSDGHRFVFGLPTPSPSPSPASSPSPSPSSSPSPSPSLTPATGFISLSEALARPNLTQVSGTLTEPWRVDATADQTFDLRDLVSTAYPTGSDSPLSIGNDDPAVGTAVVGGTVLGQISRDLTWIQVKEGFDADGLRLEGQDWFAVYGLDVDNVEDGFAPRVADGTEQDSTTRFLVQGAHFDWIRDDVVEDDDLLSGVIDDVLVDGCNRFLSARPSSGETYTNQGQVVSISNSLIHMKSMPHQDAADGSGHGSPFKWSEQAGTVQLDNVIFLVDERPVSSTDSDAMPPGTYQNVTIVLGPGFDGDDDGDFTDLDWRVPLPAGVSLTRDMNVWTTARSAWLQTHRPMTLDPGEVISLLTGDGDDQPTRFYWGSATPIWDNRGERATLRDPAGDVIDHCTYDGGVTSEAC